MPNSQNSFHPDQYVYLSHMINKDTPSFGNKNQFEMEKMRSICCGDNVNESLIHIPTHLGTHLDLPLHFYKNGQSIEDYPASFWIFNSPIFISLESYKLVIYEEIIEKLNIIKKNKLETCDILIIKTGIGADRHKEKFWKENPGFSPKLYSFFKKHLPVLRIFGFDSISLSSFQYRDIGKEAHMRFLNPEAPILILEDMKLDGIESFVQLRKIILAPLRIEKCDGVLCTIIGVS